MQKRRIAKRIIALALSLVIVTTLLPLNLLAQAEKPTVAPFYYTNWDGGAENLVLDYVYGLPYATFDPSALKTNPDRINISLYGNDAETSAINMKAAFDNRPAGTRYINLTAFRTVLLETVTDIIDMRRGVVLIKDYMERFLGKYSELEGQLDGIAIDLEYFSASSWALHTEHYSNEKKPNPHIYDQIVDSDIYKDEEVGIRKRLAERGFNFYTDGDIDENTKKEKSEIWCIYPYSGDQYATERNIWDDVISEMLTEYLNEAVYEPLQKYYPNALLSDYVVADTYRWQKLMAHDGGMVGTGYKVGNTSTQNLYDAVPGPTFFGYPSDAERTLRSNYYTPRSYNGAVYPDSPYGNALWDVIRHKTALEATDNGKITSWISYPNYGPSGAGYSGTPYYSEAVLHVGLMSTGAILGYTIKDEVIKNSSDPLLGNYDYNLQINNELMAELTRLAGASDRKPIPTPINWNDGYILTGAYAGERNIWRLTPDTSKVSVEDFKINDKAPTFSVGGLTITFPQGRIIENANITQVGTCGYWIETPADVMPVVTSDAARYSQNPSFMDTFDRYKNNPETGMFDATSVLPDTYWTVSGNASIQETDSGKALALSGNTTLTNTKVPTRITAGDDFAKKQVWEVTVTLPSSSYGTVTLLSTSNNDGVQISGTTAYYYVPGSYSWSPWKTTSFATNLQLGNTYTIRRVMDFNSNTCRCSYYIIDANGDTVAELKDKEFKSVTLPVSEISFKTSNINSTDPVRLDNYKLYPTGFTTELELYDAFNGVELTDATANRTKDTAYRLSWMNASEEYKVAEICNKVTGEVIETVKMAPGMDGVVTGIVKASESSPVNLELKTSSGNEPTHPDYSNGDFSWDSYADNLGIACIVGGQGYTTLEAGIAAAKAGQTVIMMKDAVMENSTTITESVTIQNNGFAITTTNDFNGDYVIGVANGSAMTWNTDIDAGSKTALRVCGGELTVTGGNMIGENGIEVTGGSLNMTGGTITATEKAILLSQDVRKLPAAVKISGGTLTGAYAFYHNNTTGTPSVNLSAIIYGTSVDGEVATDETHYKIETNVNGNYILHGHTVVIDAAVTPTCIETGLTEGLRYTCCNKVIIPQEIVPMQDHNWVDADCDTPGSCSTCGTTVGSALGHAWDEADCVTPKTCSTCGATEGKALGHTYTATGTNVFTCSTCKKTAEYAPVKFLFQTSGAQTGWIDASTAVNYNGVTELTLAPGQVAFYTTEKGVDGVRPNNYYLKSGANEETYNVKFDYTGDAVVVYLRDATISNTVGLFYGYSGAFNAAPLNIVVEEGTSTITTTGGMPALALFSDGDATITGPGKLNINCSGGEYPTWGAIYAGNAIKLEKADVAIHLIDGKGPTNAITSRTGGDIIIDASKLTITSPLNAKKAISSAFYGAETTSDLIIRNGSNVKIAADASYENWNGDGTLDDHTGLICIRGTVAIYNSDLEVAGLGDWVTYRRAFRNKETTLIVDGCTAQWGKETNNYPTYDAATGVITAPANLASGTPTAADWQNKAYLKVTHTHVKNDEPTYEKAYPCATHGVAVYTCQYCGMEMREQGVEVKPTADHTPMDTYEMINRATSITGLGSYKIQTKCSACGKVLEESDPISFGAAPFYYYASDMGTTENNWLTNATLKHLLNPGDPTVYLSTTTNASYPGYQYLTTGSEGNWNVKLEYPWGGTPTMTLKGATIKNGCGIFYGFFTNETTAPLNIVVESDSTIEVTQTTGNNNNCALALNTTGGVTISGPGKLTLKCNSNRGPLSVRGNLTLDNTNIHIEVPYQYPQGPMIQAYNGDLTIKGGTLYGNAYGENKDSGIVSYLVEANNLTVQDGANVTLFGAACLKHGNSAFNVTDDITINKSNVEFATLGITFDYLFNKAPIVSAGCIAVADHAGSYEGGVLIAPEEIGEFNPDNLRDYYYYKVTKTPTLQSSVTAGSSLTFTMSVPVADIEATNLTAQITKNGETTTAEVSIQDVYGVPSYVVEYAGVAAKEMGDEFTLALFDAAGNSVIEPLTDSIREYAIRGMESTAAVATPALKRLLADMLVYGAAAQKQFTYNTDKLVTYGLDEYIDQYATKADVDFNYASAATITGDNANAYYGASFILESDITMLVGIKSSYLEEGAYAIITFTDNYGKSLSEAEQRVEINEKYSKTNFKAFAFNGLAAADGDCDVTFEIFNPGESTPVIVVTDSLKRYCNRARDDVHAAVPLMKYTTSARAYLHPDKTN